MSVSTLTVQLLRPVKCPICLKGKIVDVPKNTPPYKIILYSAESDPAQCFVKCPKCKSQVGISIE